MTWFTAATWKGAGAPPELEKFYQAHNLSYISGREHENVHLITAEHFNKTLLALWNENHLEALFFSEALFVHIESGSNTDSRLKDHIKLMRKKAFKMEPWLILVYSHCFSKGGERTCDLIGTQPDNYSKVALVNKAIKVLKEGGEKDPELLNSPAINLLTARRIESFWNTGLYDITTEYPYESLSAEHKGRYDIQNSEDQLKYCNHIFNAIHENILFIKWLSDNPDDITIQSFDKLLKKIADFRFFLSRQTMKHQTWQDQDKSTGFGTSRKIGLNTPFHEGAYKDYYIETIKLICKHYNKPNAPDSILEILDEGLGILLFKLQPLSDLDKNIDKTSACFKKIDLLNSGPKLSTSLKKTREGNPTFTLIHLDFEHINLYLSLGFFHFEKFLKASQTFSEKLEQLMRCIYYIDVATPYERGSAEIVNMIHMAMRAHMGLPVRNVHFVHILDRAVLTSMNYAEFRQKYLSECHPKLTTQGNEINWDNFEEIYYGKPLSKIDDFETNSNNFSFDSQLSDSAHSNHSSMYLRFSNSIHSNCAEPGPPETPRVIKSKNRN